MSDVWARIGICAGISLVVHFGFTEVMDLLPPAEAAANSPPVEIRVIEPQKQVAPEPDPEPEPPKPDPEQPKPEPPKKLPPLTPHPPTQQPQTAVHDVAPVDTPPTDHAVTTDSTTTPVYGVTMESTSQGGRGPAMPVGNTTNPAAGSGAPTRDPVKPLAAPVAAYEVTKLPLPQGRCAGKYTDDARAAGIEGVVVLDLIVDERGRTRDITVVQGLDHGLTQAAIAALTSCTFTPGEKGGQAVPVRVRGFKIRFVMSDAN